MSKLDHLIFFAEMLIGAFITSHYCNSLLVSLKKYNSARSCLYQCTGYLYLTFVQNLTYIMYHPQLSATTSHFAFLLVSHKKCGEAAFWVYGPKVSPSPWILEQLTPLVFQKRHYRPIALNWCLIWIDCFY